MMSEKKDDGNSGKKSKPEMTKYRDNALEAFRMGACFDMRVRFAMNLLEHSPVLGANAAARSSPWDLAREALEIATALFEEAEKRGLIEPFVEFDEYLEAHIRRQVTFQMAVQKETQRQADEAARMPRAVAGAFRKDN